MTEELNKSIGFKINQIASKINQQFNYILQDYNIALEQRVTLEIISADKNITQTKISTILGKDKTTICRALNSLEKKGFIIKEENKEDKRVNIIKLTQKAYKVLKDTEDIIQNYRNVLSSNLKEEEITTLFKILEKISIKI
ncbi:hypothetical protein CPU12_08260 [Malaciobacter molluscorum LMG 25693]|uniref:Transcriptional regulator, MarR family n=1 Tax=Malaciobacter molluscorum LMG 25693 TaxID=870501 RepID=A0A2G1DHD1_9BACT|nr:MarR family transcriptional regulator [Malaciobacter molluscorum]AXX93671.1 transcriptional regulator, MarR family [Malaciobacter molluscorum LMG 25693]PHO17919.1 hypothetical protein CPU12_08260 [Malaciobacter molluscorum LMG 25693]